MKMTLLNRPLVMDLDVILVRKLFCMLRLNVTVGEIIILWSTNEMFTYWEHRGI